MNFQIFLYSTVFTILFYIGLVTHRYIKDEWQWSCLYPKKFIFPKRIKNKIRPSILEEYRVLNILSLSGLEDFIEEDISGNKINRIDFARYSITAKTNIFSEINFKYFLFLKQASIILQPLERNGSRAEIYQAIKDLKKINEVFSRHYIRKSIGGNDRSIILAEILYRTLTGSSMEMPYGYETYSLISCDTVIAKYEDIIKAATLDEELVDIIQSVSIANSSVYQKGTTSRNHAILLRIYILLLTKWL